MKRLIIYCLCLLLVYPSTAEAIEQKQQTKLSVSPAITEWLAAPGQTITKSIVVRNITKDILPLQVFVQSMQIDEVIEARMRQQLDASTWFSIQDSDLILRAHQSRKIKVTLRIPKNAEPGSKYATIYFRELASVTGKPQTNIIPRVGVLSFVVVKGKITKWLQPEQFSVGERSGKALIATSVRNTGNVHAFPQGTLVIKDWWGKPIDRLSLPTGLVLPGTARTFQHEWQPPAPGIYTVTSELALGSQVLPPLSTTIWWLPWREMIICCLGIATLWFGVFRIRKRWKRAFDALRR